MRTAVFDLDGTIILNTSGLLLAQEIENLGKFKNWQEFGRAQRLLIDGQTSFNDAIIKLSDLFAAGVKGLDTSSMNTAIDALRKKIIARCGFSRLYHYLRNRKYVLCLLTASPNEATVPLVTELPFDMVFSLQLEIIDGIYTGRHYGAMTANRKIDILNETIFPNCDFAFGVGNTYEDMFIFQKLSLRFIFQNTSVRDIQYPPSFKIKTFVEIIDVLENREKASTA